MKFIFSIVYSCSSLIVHIHICILNVGIMLQDLVFQATHQSSSAFGEHRLASFDGSGWCDIWRRRWWQSYPSLVVLWLLPRRQWSIGGILLGLQSETDEGGTEKGWITRDKKNVTSAKFFAINSLQKTSTRGSWYVREIPIRSITFSTLMRPMR